MSDYDYDDRRSRRSNRSRVPEYIKTEDTFVAKGAGARDLIVRGGRDRDDDYYDDDVAIRRRSVHEDYGRRRARSQGHRDRDSYYGDDDYDDDYRSRRGHRSRYDDNSYYSDDYDRPRERRKSRVGEAIEGLGLGGVVAAVTGRSKSQRRRSSGGSDRSYRSRSRSRDTRKKWQQAAKAAVISGVIEAVRSRNAPGPWTGEKGQRVATAALGAAGIDGFLDRDPDRKSKRHIVESVIGGLVATRIANGSVKNEGRGRSLSRSRSRSRSQSRSVLERVRSRSRSILSRGRSASRGRTGTGAGGSGLKDLAIVGGVAAAGKAIYDRVRSKSRGRDDRGRGRDRDRSVSSEDSYVPSRQQRYGQRNRGGPDRGFDSSQDDRGRNTEQGPDGANRARSSSSSTVSTTDLEKQRRKTRTKELLTAGLATVATIHAAHGVYNSMVASEKRHKMVLEGEMSPEEARKRKSKNMLQDAAAVGIAALGIKSAFGEWKEMNESRKEKHELEARRRRHHKAREKKARELQQAGQQWGIGGGGGYPGYPPGPGYGDANPYQAYGQNQAYAGSLPPPPMGGPPR